MCRRSLMQPALNECLMEAVVASANVRTAWKRVKSNGGAAGIDGVTVEEYVEQVRPHWENIRNSLLQGTYQPEPVRRAEIPKRSGGKRPLGIPTVCDRLIQQSLQQVLTPTFDPKFSESSYGFRLNHSAHEAVRQVRRCETVGPRERRYPGNDRRFPTDASLADRSARDRRFPSVRSSRTVLRRTGFRGIRESFLFVFRAVRDRRCIASAHVLRS